MKIADHTIKKFCHITKDGDRIPLRKLSDTHLQNIIKLILKKSKEGITIIDGGGTDALEIWYDEYTIIRESVLQKLNYKEYTKERDRRKL